MPRLPENIAVSPMTLLCPRCHAEPGKVCEKLAGVVEIIHVERIKAAVVKEGAAKQAREDGLPKRAVRLVKHIGTLPCVAVCTNCGREFKTSTADRRSAKDATASLQRQFDAHKCNRAAVL